MRTSFYFSLSLALHIIILLLFFIHPQLRLPTPSQSIVEIEMVQAPKGNSSKGKRAKAKTAGSSLPQLNQLVPAPGILARQGQGGKDLSKTDNIYSEWGSGSGELQR